jgi:soluble lytic murein transglycosylase
MMIFIFLLLFATEVFAADDVKAALDLMQKERWNPSLEAASRSGRTELTKIILSQKYLDPKSDASFEEIVKFLSKNQDWPGADEIAINAEKKISAKTPTTIVKKWFDKHPPTTPSGHKFRAYAEIAEYKKTKERDKNAAIQIVKDGWINGEFDAKEQEFYLKRYHKVIVKEDHAKKVNVLLWRGNIKAAKQMLNFLHPQHRKMFLARIASMENLQDAAIIYSKLDEKEKYHSGVLYEYINHQLRSRTSLRGGFGYRPTDAAISSTRRDIKKYSSKHSEIAESPTASRNDDLLLADDNSNNITKLILHAPNDLENSDKWWKLKTLAIRELIESKNYKDAYLIASKHYSIKSEDKSDALWMSGWIAFSFLHRPEIAAKHFEKYYQNVKKPNTISKAAYWMAKSLAATQHKQVAYKWIAKAAAFPETFYGQLANEYMNKKNFHLNITPKLEAKYRAKFENNDLIKALYLLQKYKKYNLAQNYMKSAINHSSHPVEVLLITQIAKEDEITVANHKNPQYFLPKERVEPALVYAIIRQESAFNPQAISNKNARGLMQIRPDTAKDLARELKIEYSEAKLTSDVSYNINLGTKCLKNLIDQFNGSYILALCAYNAGPGKAHEWIERFGDPRSMKSIHDIVNWIELISYSQTREYVQKVMENLQIYRYILKDERALKIRGDLVGNHSPYPTFVITSEAR